MSEWKKVKIGDIFAIEKGSLQSSKNTPGKYDFITAASEWKNHNSYDHDCEAIVYAVAASGSLGRAHYVNGKFIASDLCFILTEKNKDKYPVNFLFYQIIFEMLRDEIVSKTKTGTSKESINRGNFSNYEIPYFPIDFQLANYQRFVDAKNTIKTLIDEYEKQKSYAKQLRQNILQDAIEGKLTEDWRKKHPLKKGDPDYDAEALFAKIQEEKQKLITEGKIKKEKSLAPISTNEIPFEIPKSWKWVRLSHIIYDSPRNGYSPKAVEKETSTKTLKLGAVTKGVFDPSECKYIDEIVPEDSVFWLKNGDFLIERSNSLDFVGICAIYNGVDGDFIYPDLIMKFRVNKTLNHSFFHKAIIAPYNRDYYQSHASGAQKSMPKINQDCVVNTILPLPPLDEQKEIVTRVEAELQTITQLETQIATREATTKQLMQSILKDAFEE